jgi:hypothetical protein
VITIFCYVMPCRLVDRLLHSAGINLHSFTYQKTDVKSFVLSEHEVTTEDIQKYLCVRKFDM